MKVLTLTRGILQNGKVFFITDTTDTYGTDLPARNTLGLVDVTFIRKSDNTIQRINASTYDPETVTVFNYNVENLDGVYFTYIFALTIYTGQPLLDEQVVYDPADGLVKQWNDTDGELVIIDPIVLIDNEDIDYGEIVSKIDTQTTYYRDKLLLVVNKSLEEYLQNSCEYDEYQKALLDYNRVRLLLAQAHIRFCQGSYALAQQSIETANEYAKKALDIE